MLPPLSDCRLDTSVRCGGGRRGACCPAVWYLGGLPVAAPGGPMNRRQFLHTTAAAALAGAAVPAPARSAGPGFASPADAKSAPRETQLYVIALYGGTGVHKPDYLATVDVDPKSPN